MNSKKAIRVKVCGLTDRENIIKLSELEIDFAGFNFYPASPRYVGNDPGKILSYKLPAHIARTGVFVNQDLKSVSGISRMHGLDYVQLHGSEPEDYCRKLKDQGFKVIRAFSIGPGFDFRSLETFTEVIDLFVFDSRMPGDMKGGVKFNWSLLESYSLDIPFLLAGGIGPGDAKRIKTLDHGMFYGVDLNSRFELTTGIKDTAMILEFISELKS